MSILISVINGPNLNLVGEREQDVYGVMSWREIEEQIRSRAEEMPRPVKLIFQQSNHEGEIIDVLHRYRSSVDGILINPGAFTHYSYAIRDALKAIQPPAVEVHLSDIEARESFRSRSVIQPVCIKQIMGKGPQSYLQGLEYLVNRTGGNKDD
ncbi:MAG: type II 3-dehydroquinate dehydratase [Candidatus Bipolaricaulota bacterium]